MSVKSSDLCEVRVPTFRRPRLLKRALSSIIDQTHVDWRCVVFDDCPMGSARSVVDKMQDDRISYIRNLTQLGATGNIDRSFTRGPLLGGRYAFVLEDDNYLLPDHIERSIHLLAANNVKVAFCNQYCEIVKVADEPGQIGNNQILDWMYQPGCQHPESIMPALLFSHGFSNGAVFWRTDCTSDFQIGGLTRWPEVQESLRLLQLKEPVFISLAPTSVWRPREPQRRLSATKFASWLRRAVTNQINRLLVEKEKIGYRALVIKILGAEAILHFIDTNAIPDFSRHRDARLLTMERSMLLCGYNPRLTKRGTVRRGSYLLLGIATRSFLPKRLGIARESGRSVVQSPTINAPARPASSGFEYLDELQ